ncbi:MAG: hypothetical protein KIT09_21605 [Bryobacteraceae bacterium]|nr:hypothetical protein [Bryobacteraceae bacterium]
MNEHPENAHEKTDVSIRGLVYFGAGVVALIGVAAVAMLLLFKFLEARPEPPASPLAHTRESPPEPRLQVNPSRDLDRLLTAETNLLDSYGWVDKDAGVVRIPVDRAIAMLAERGFPEDRRLPQSAREANR